MDSHIADLHRRATVVDGLVFFSDGSTRDMLAGGVSAINVTVSDMGADFEQALRDCMAWRQRCAAPDSSRRRPPRPASQRTLPSPRRTRNSCW